MLYPSGFLFPLPASIRRIAFASPAYYLGQPMLRVAGVPASACPAAAVAVLVGTTLLPGAFAIHRLARRG